MKDQLKEISDVIEAHKAEITKLEAEYSDVYLKHVVETNNRSAHLTYAQVAKLLKLDVRTLRNLMHKERYAVMRIKKGKIALIRYADVVDHLITRDVKRGCGQLAPDRRKAAEDLLTSGVHTVPEIAEMLGVAKRTIYRVQKAIVQS